MIDNTILQKVVWRIKDTLLQWLWFFLNVQRDHIGYDKGLLTWQREARHRNLRRNVHICLLEVHPKEGKFGRFTTFWINERSRICSASLNERMEDADVVWTYSQDPLPADVKRELLRTLNKTRPGTPVINHPEAYNSYHEKQCFERLEKAGVSVPRSEFTAFDIGKTPVVYKTKGKHGSTKFLSIYAGPIDGYRPFQFVDGKSPEGLYRKFRVLYVVGIIYPNYVAFSEQWNVERSTIRNVEYIFEMTPIEIESVNLIAQTLNLQYFSVDYLRRNTDDVPVFTDINVYPQPIAFTETARDFGYYGRWHIVDNHLRLNIPTPFKKPFWSIFDDAMAAFVRKNS